jgi:hypothetical protein
MDNQELNDVPVVVVPPASTVGDIAVLSHEWLGNRKIDVLGTFARDGATCTWHGVAAVYGSQVPLGMLKLTAPDRKDAKLFLVGPEKQAFADAILARVNATLDLGINHTGTSEKLIASATKKEKAARYDLASGSVPLHAYTLPDGRVLREEVQCQGISGRRHTELFLYLVDNATGEPIRQSFWQM